MRALSLKQTLRMRDRAQYKQLHHECLGVCKRPIETNRNFKNAFCNFSSIISKACDNIPESFIFDIIDSSVVRRLPLFSGFNCQVFCSYYYEPRKIILEVSPYT
jgi:hypothetical protein